MSFSQPPNPYQSPDYQKPFAPAAPPPRGIPKLTRLEYLDAFQYVFESPNWAMNLLAGSLAVFSQSVVPIIGLMVFMGYQAEILEHLHRRRTMPYPDFDFNRLAEYLSRGVPPLVVGLVFGLVMAPLIMLFYAGTIFGVILTLGGLSAADAPPALAAGAVLALGLLAGAVLFLCLIALTMLMTPLMLAAELSRKVSEGFNFRFAWDFAGRMWREMFLVILWLSLMNLLLSVAGLMMACVGVYPATAWSWMASTHMRWQLYELYLAQGGEPILLREEARTAAS